MPVSPLDDAVGPVNVQIKADGKVVDDAPLLSVDVEARANRIPRATVVYEDGGAPAASEFPLTDAQTFKPGSAVTITAGYGDASPTTIFSGEVVGVHLRISDANRIRLNVECRHKALAMTHVRKSRIFVDKRDDEVMARLVSDAALAPTVTQTQPKWVQLAQNDATDWDFMLARAEANGLIVLATVDEQIHVETPDPGAAATLKVAYGLDLVGFEGALDARNQHEQTTAQAWSPVTGGVSAATAQAPGLDEAGAGNLGPAALAKALKTGERLLRTAQASADGSLRPWAEGTERRAALAGNRARLTFTGTGKAVPGTTIEIANLGERFSGKAYVGAVRHRIEAGQWLTEIDTGLDVETHAERHALTQPPAAALVPPVHGLQIGLVRKLEADPGGLLRIQVQLPLYAGNEALLWARLATPYATSEGGFFAPPEIDDEVVLGFLNDDPREAVVLGCLYGQKSAMPQHLQDTNNTKSLITREKLEISFDEEKKVITIVTPAQNQLVLSDDGKSITITDQNNNKVVLDGQGITLDSPKDVKIKAQGQVDIQATRDVAINGANVTANADMGVKAVGSATAELSSGGQTTVKGAMVMIN